MSRSAAPPPSPASPLAGENALLRARLAELERHVDEVQAIASLGSFQWLVAEDRIEWSAEQLRIHGLEAAAHPRTFADFLACVHPEDRPRVAALTEAGVRERRPTECRYRTVRPDGEVRLLQARARVVVGAGGEVERVVGTSQDVTRFIEVERDRSEEHFRRLIEHAHDLIVIVDEDGIAHYGSPSVRRVLGYDPDAITGTSILRLVHEEDVHIVRAWLARLVAEPGVEHRAEYRFRHQDGHWVYLEAVSTGAPDYRPRSGHVMNIRDVTERREAELALQASEEHFRQLIENGGDFLVISDVAGPIRYASSSSERLLGYAPAEMVGAVPTDLVHPDDVRGVHETLEACGAAPGTIRAMEFRLRHRDGSWRRFQSLARTLVPDSDRAGIVCNGRDVTEQRAAEEALRRSEEHFRALIENGSDLLMIAAPDLRLSYVSPSAERLLGYTPEEMLAKSPAELLHPDDVESVVRLTGEILASPGTVMRFPWRIRHKDGRWRLIDAIGRTLDPHSAADGVVCNGRDITEHRAAEEALQRSEEHFRRLIEHSYDLVQVLSPDGRVVYTGPSVQRLLGYTPEEVSGGTLADFMHPDDLPAAAALVGQILANPGVPGSLEYRVRHKDGSWRWLEAWARTLSATSAAEGLVANARDITERREAEDALRAAKEEAERANHAKSEFLSRMSHELRTPLNSILGFAQVLEDLDLPTEYATGLRHILNGGRHLLNLINEVLDIARIEADQQPLSLEPVRVSAAVREAVDMVRPLAAARGVRVAVTPNATLERYVRADRQRLTQVLLNLLSNAVKYNRPAGLVLVGAEEREDGGAGRVRVRVTDEGPGIAPERRDELFVPFARLGAEHTGVEGTGLGLALSQRLARAMGGALLLESSDAEGSTFAVDLEPAADPLADVPAPGARAERAAATHAPATLLYVEDNLANLSLVETILLSRPGWRLVPALQGRLGVELAREHLPDLVLLDLHLPDLPGRDVLRQLRGDPRTAETPVVIISADATPRTIEALLAEGADAFLTKPLDVRAFVATVERLLRRRATA